MKPGTITIVPALTQRRNHCACPRRRLIELRRRAAVLAVGLHDLDRIDARHAPPEAPDGGRQQQGRDALAASHQRVLAAQPKVSDRIDRRTDVAILTSGVIDRVRQLAKRLAAAEKHPRRLLMLARERVRGCRRGLQQQVGDAGKGGRDDDERPAMCGNSFRRRGDGASVRQ